MRSFAEYLREIDRGRLLTDLTADFKDLVRAVTETGKPGSLTLTLTLKPQGVAADTVMVEAAVKLKDPQPSRAGSLFFVSDDLNLTRRDPRQLELADVAELVKTPAPSPGPGIGETG